MDKLKLAIIGLSHVHAQLFFKQFSKYENEIEWLGCADVEPYDEEKVNDKLAKNMPRLTPPKIFKDYKELLDLKPDIAIVCTDIKDHGRIAVECLERNIHTIVEKPMATSYEDALMMAEASKKSGAELIINWPVAWSGSFRKAYELLKEGKIGKPYRFNYRSPATTGPYPVSDYPESELKEMWWYKRERGGGVIYDYAGYGCTIATWFFGKRANKVTAMAKNFSLGFADVDDYSAYTIDFGDSMAMIEASWCTITSGEVPTGPCIYGEKGCIICDRYSDEVKVYTSFRATTPDEVYKVEDFNEDIALHTINHFKYGKPLHLTMTPEFNLDSVAALDAGIRSIESGKTEETAR